MKIYKNLETGSVVEGLLMDVVPSGYRELKAGGVDAAQEKHVPQVSVEDNKIKVVVGSVEHPMLEAHYITNIWVEYSDGTVDRAGLVPGMKPEYVFITDVPEEMAEELDGLVDESDANEVRKEIKE